jgi:hypothetical protein
MWSFAGIILWCTKPFALVHRTASVVQVWSKPMSSGGAAAVLLVNMGEADANLLLRLSDYVGAPATVRDIWNQKDMGPQAGTMNFAVGSHDSVFLLLTPS